MYNRLRNLIPLELIIWIAALAALMIAPMESSGLSLCPLDNLGFKWCPGCGLGHSVSHALHGNLEASLAVHPLGIFALLVIVYRIIQLFRAEKFEQRIPISQSEHSHERS